MKQITIDQDLISIPAAVLQMVDPGGFWDYMLSVTRDKACTMNEAFYICNDLYYEYIGKYRFSDIRAARTAYKCQLGKQRNKLLPARPSPRANFAKNIPEMAKDKNKKWPLPVEFEINDQAPREELERDFPELKPIFAMADEWKKLPAKVLTREEWEAIREGAPGVATCTGSAAAPAGIDPAKIEKCNSVDYD